LTPRLERRLSRLGDFPQGVSGAAAEARKLSPAPAKPAGFGTPAEWQNAWTAANPGKAPPWLASSVLGAVLAPASAGAAPAAPAAPSGPAPPSYYDSILQGDYDRIERDKAVGLAGIGAAEDAALLESGLTGDRIWVDPVTGRQVDPAELKAQEGTEAIQKLTNVRLTPNVDVSNPNSRAALLKKMWDQGQVSTRNNLASRGQLYSGYQGAKQNSLAAGYAQGTDSLMRSYGSLLQELFARRYGITTGANEARSAADSDAMGRHIDEPGPAPPEAPPVPAAPAIHPGMSAKEQLAALGGVLFIGKDGIQRIKRPDGSIYDLNGNKIAGPSSK
jgi:hypothetical protein